MTAADIPDCTHGGSDEIAAISDMNPGIVFLVGFEKVIVFSGWQYLSTSEDAELWSSTASLPQREEMALEMETVIFDSSAVLLQMHDWSFVGSEPQAVLSCSQRYALVRALVTQGACAC